MFADLGLLHVCNKILCQSLHCFYTEGSGQPLEEESQVWMATQVGADTRNTQYCVEVFLYNKKNQFTSAKVISKTAYITVK